MNKSEHINELAAALVKFQAEVQDAERTAKSYNGKYAELEQIYSIIRPILSKYGIAFKQDLVSSSPSEVKIQTWLMHSSGQYMMTEVTVGVPAANNKTNSLQQVGICATYLKRYAIMGAVGITQKDEMDDDGDGIGKEKPKFEHAKSKTAHEDFSQIQPWQFGEEMINDMNVLIQNAGYTKERVLERYGVKDLKELTRDQYDQTIRVCNKAIKDKEGKK